MRLTTDGHITLAERDRRHSNNLCLYCESLDTSTVTVLATHVQPSTTPVVPERDPVMLPQPRPNQPTNATTTNVATVAMAMDSLVKGTSGEPPSQSWLPTHQQNPQLLHPPRLAWETRR